jgi:hypothetical protein
MRTTADARSIRGVVLLITLAALAIGGLLWVPSLRVGRTPPTTAPVAAANAARAIVVPAPHAAAAEPLPTIAPPSPTPALTPLAMSHGAKMAPTTTATGQMAPAASPPTVPAAGTAALVAHLIKQLGCIAPGARHDAALDAVAARRAQQDDTPHPTDGTIQIAERDGQRLLLGLNQLAELERPHGRCGETLIFGIPPLDWLPSGTRFGLGVDARDGGVVIVVVTA